MAQHPSSQALNTSPDVVLIGGGVMSVTLGTFLKQLDPALTIQVIEALPQVAQESSAALNNAGTGHAALCELNYTPEDAHGNVDISNAIRINEQFETSKHFWSYLVEEGVISDPSSFIQPVAHMSFVRGDENQAFLKRRFEAMKAHLFFRDMEYTTEHMQIGAWIPLLLEGRNTDEPLAVTRVARGTDVNYGALTRQLFEHLQTLDGVQLALSTEVKKVSRRADGRWLVKVKDDDGRTASISSKFVFIGAGGGTLALLQQTGIPESKGYGGFPVSGKFLICKDKTIVKKHAAKVYGKAAVGAPPMSVPHLDSRSIDGRPSLLFGPFAGFSPKFLKSGSNMDLLKSVRGDNLFPMLAAGRDNIPLTKYLIGECTKTHAQRCATLREFFPDARDEDWSLLTAGQRVQIIKKDSDRTGKLEFGTEVVAAKDGSLAAVLGASPGASTAVSIILTVLEQCFPQQMKSDAWGDVLKRMVPAFGTSMATDEALYERLCERVDNLLQIRPDEKKSVKECVA